MSSHDPEAAFAELARARHDGDVGARLIGTFEVGARLHVGDGDTYFCHVMERTAAGRWELWRLHTEAASGAFALRAGGSPTRWLGAGTIQLDTSLAAFIPDAAAEEIQALEDEDVEFDLGLGGGEAGADVDEPAEAIVKTPGGAALALVRLARDGAHQVDKGLDGRGAVCALAILG